FLAFVEGDALDVAAHARAQFDAFDRADAAVEGVPLVHGLTADGGDADRGRRRHGRGVLGAAVATGDGERQRERGRGQQPAGAGAGTGGRPAGGGKLAVGHGGTE